MNNRKSFFAGILIGLGACGYLALGGLPGAIIFALAPADTLPWEGFPEPLSLPSASLEWCFPAASSIPAAQA